MKEKEPFAFARNLKIFIIVLCLLPIVGILMFIFLPKQMNGFSVELVPGTELSVDVGTLLDTVREGGESSAETDAAMTLLVGDIAKTMSVNPQAIAGKDAVYIVNPFTHGRDGWVGVEIFVFGFSYGHYEENLFGTVVTPDLDMTKLAPCEEGTHYGLMNFRIGFTERLVFDYNYKTGELESYNGEGKYLNLARLDINLTEDTATDRLVRTLYAEMTTKTVDANIFSQNDFILESRITPGGFTDTVDFPGVTIIGKGAYAGEREETGCYFRLDTAGRIEKLKDLSCGIINIEADRTGEESYPSFRVELKLFYTVIE